MSTPSPPPPPPVDRRRCGSRALFALMADQHGVASRAQARGVGVTRAVEERLVDEGALARLFPTVLGAGGVRPTYSAQAMAAALLPGVLGISHGAAARLHRLAGFEHHPQIDVIGPRTRHLRVAAPVVAHYSRGPIDEHVVLVGPIRVTSIPLTLALLAPLLTGVRTAAAVADALDRGIPAPTIRAVAERWRGIGRAGPAQLLDVLDRLAPPFWAASSSRSRRVAAQNAR